MKENNTIEQIKNALVKKSPEILVGIGVAGMWTTVVLAVKATPKAMELLSEARESEDSEEGFTPLEMIRIAWRPYIPTIILGAVSTACLVGASSVNLRRNTALATAYTISDSAVKNYKDAVSKAVSDKKLDEINGLVAKDKLDRDPTPKNEVLITGSGDTLCYDGTLGGYFNSDIQKIKNAENTINRRMRDEMTVSVNDFYDELGRQHIGEGYDLGWNIDDGYLEVEFSSQLTSDGKPCLVIEYRVIPI